MNKNSLLKNTDSLFKEKMLDGWNIHVECKAKGRGYEMTYEATATRNHVWEANFEMKHAVGNTLDELINNLFNNPVVEQKGIQWEQFTEEERENLKSYYKAAGENPVGE